MIEEIQALMPLFEKISDGALYAFLAYLAANVLPSIVTSLIWCIGLYYIIKVSLHLVGNLIHQQGSETIDLYELKLRGETIAGGTRYIGDIEALELLLQSIKSAQRGEFNYLHDSDLMEAAEVIREHGQKT